VGRIAILPTVVIDQIAAGEVVERPASVVKELVENALDAGAHNVTVELEDGGKSLIRVGDDGAGMDRDDAVLAIDRHATSKIRSATELIGVPTYGFRGEALAAIAAVSVFELETAAAEGGTGVRIAVRGGRLESVEDVARTRGTTVVVRRLFAKTPARRKFLRSARSETRAAVEALAVLALARLDVSFVLTSDGRRVTEAPRVASVADRIAALFGRELAEQLVPVEHNDGYATVRGLVQRPAAARRSGRRAYLFVNGRPFRNPFIVRAAEAGYRATIPQGVRPSLFLALHVPGDRVDVNVHPAKLEVRFRDKVFVERVVEEGVRAALRPVAAAAVAGSRHVTPGAPAVREATVRAEAAREHVEGEVQSLLGVAEPLFAPPESRPLLQVFNTYIVFETPEGLAVVDQHSAHERVLYEQAMAQLAAGAAVAQRLLLPLTVDLAPQELEAVDAHRDLFTSLGYEVEPFGGRSVVLHAVPNPHPRFDAGRCFEELVGDLAQGRLGGLSNRLERFAATYGCRAAVKAGQVLDPVEMQELIQRLLACELPPHDVHGRPAMVILSRTEVGRRFGRT
jgi:DNA mismatch repair protein MutL